MPILRRFFGKYERRSKHFYRGIYSSVSEASFFQCMALINYITRRISHFVFVYIVISACHYLHFINTQGIRLEKTRDVHFSFEITT